MQKTYQQKLQAQLAQYKVQRLGVLENGTFSYRGQPRLYAHILPKRLAWLNVPEPFRREIREHVTREHIKLHKYFHHLNSSQAFTFALFIPYLMEAPKVLGAALGAPSIDKWQIERIIDSKEETNVDAWWRSSSGDETYCEVKLTETSFGAAEDDSRHRRKLRDIYGPVLKKYVDSQLLEPELFFRYYQIFRNIWLAARPGREADRVVFLLPGANRKSNAQLRDVLKHVAPQLRHRVDVVHIEAVLAALTMKPGEPDLRWYRDLLTEKYLLQ